MDQMIRHIQSNFKQEQFGGYFPLENLIFSVKPILNSFITTTKIYYNGILLLMLPSYKTSDNINLLPLLCTLTQCVQWFKTQMKSGNRLYRPLCNQIQTRNTQRNIFISTKINKSRNSRRIFNYTHHRKGFTVPSDHYTRGGNEDGLERRIRNKKAHQRAQRIYFNI